LSFSLCWLFGDRTVCREGSVALTTQHPLSAKVGTTSPTSGDRSVGIVRYRNKSTKVFFFRILPTFRRSMLLIYSVPKDNPDSKQSSACSTLKSTVIWAVTSCSLIDVYRRFGGIYCLQLQGLRVSQANNQNASFCLFDLLSSLKMEAVCSSEMSVIFS
jgi:hypothetical protein